MRRRIARHQRPLPAGLRHPDEPRDDDLAVARAGRRHGCYWYSIFTSFGAPVDKDTMRAQRLRLIRRPTTSPSSAQNDWGFNPDEQRTQTFIGMGYDINIHDQWACECMGALQDRTREHLGTTDKVIVPYRRILLDAIRRNAGRREADDGARCAGRREITGPPAMDGIGPQRWTWKYWQDFERESPRGNHLGMNKKEALKEIEAHDLKAVALFVRRPARHAARQALASPRWRRARARRHRHEHPAPQGHVASHRFPGLHAGGGLGMRSWRAPPTS